MRKADYAALAEYHAEQANDYRKQASRCGGELAKNARSYASYHAEESRKFKELENNHA